MTRLQQFIHSLHLQIARLDKTAAFDIIDIPVEDMARIPEANRTVVMPNGTIYVSFCSAGCATMNSMAAHAGSADDQSAH